MGQQKSKLLRMKRSKSTAKNVDCLIQTDTHENVTPLWYAAR